MKVKIIVFGQITDITGRNEWTVEDMEDTDQLIEYMHANYPLLSRLQYRIAVDKNFIDSNTMLNENCTVAFLPPFSGG